ncbi:hypothetical protein [Lutibacter flavus]|uniref:50S ribosomal protein L27 n=1 Tax=Lutibacter flavus TaxID=691689 RepID=A0A238Y6W7_9FLAO|nr:hypothetical protein [Lutibacter flavus]SNR66568.1 hypothetical protein SAMN04488111_2314 [Lutibacter flavus]
MIKMIHSYWAYLVLIVLILAVVNAILGLTSKKKFEAKDVRISLFALIASHIQLIIGFISYYMSSFYETMRGIGMGEVMKNSELRKLLVEHPLMMIISIILITIGFSKHKKKTTDLAKFKTISIFYTIALIIILGMIPWNLWFSN